MRSAFNTVRRLYNESQDSELINIIAIVLLFVTIGIYAATHVYSKRRIKVKAKRG